MPRHTEFEYRPMNERLKKFLGTLQTAYWRDVPKHWHHELREAIEQQLVKVGWGGVLELTDAGRKALKS